MSEIENAQIRDLNDKFGSIEEKLDTTISSLNRVTDAILGTEYNPGGAYKTRIENLELFKTKIELKIFKAQVWATVVGGILIALLELLYKSASIWASVHK